MKSIEVSSSFHVSERNDFANRRLKEDEKSWVIVARTINGVMRA